MPPNYSLCSRRTIDRSEIVTPTARIWQQSVEVGENIRVESNLRDNGYVEVSENAVSCHRTKFAERMFSAIVIGIPDIVAEGATV